MKLHNIVLICVLLVSIAACNTQNQPADTATQTSPETTAPTTKAASADWNFHHDLYDKMHDSPMQRKFRNIAPMPFGVVFLPWAGCTEDDMRKHFRLMKKLGFTNLKQTMPTPEWTTKQILEIALDEGIIPYWYGQGGWENITPELLTKLGLPADMPIAEARNHPKMVAYQTKVIANQLEVANGKQTYLDGEWYEHTADQHLRSYDVEPFKQWVRNKYKTIEELNRAWNQYEVGIDKQPFKTWADFEAYQPDVYEKNNDGYVIIPSAGREYGRVTDVLRYKADRYIESVKKVKGFTPDMPVRAGGEMGLFLPFASRATDMEGIAEAMTEVGSFYPSIHLAWHFEEVGYEVGPCVYMQSSIANDWFKGGWASTWESTGGPQQLSGGKGWNIMSQFETAGFTVNEGTITQLLLGYLAGGFKGVGLWAWNYRMAGWESGEYALLNRQNEPGPRAIKAGKIAQAANKYRDELWQAHKEPEVGVLVDYNNEMIWAAVAGPGRTHFKHYPVKARVGISRALIENDIPFEYVTPTDLQKGLFKRYKRIYMPAQAAIHDNLWPVLTKFVEQGGTLLMDAPGGWWDQTGRVLNTNTGSPFEKLFGAKITDFQYSNNVPFNIDDKTLNGFVLAIEPTTAQVTETFENRNEPRVTVNQLGKGKAILLAPDCGYAMFKKGNTTLENWVAKQIMGGATKPYTCTGTQAYAFRIAAPNADHYFLINDNEAQSVELSFNFYKYTSAIDAITGEAVELGKAIEIPAYNGRWIRCEK